MRIIIGDVHKFIGHFLTLKCDDTCHGLAYAGGQAGGSHGQLVDDRLQTNGGDISQLFLLPHHVVAQVVYNGLNLRVFNLNFIFFLRFFIQISIWQWHINKITITQTIPASKGTLDSNFL